jgi:hypothetical protein
MVKLYVEGGGDTTELKGACREGFRTFISKAGIIKRPRIVACGSRRDAFESYCTAIASWEEALLLVDSEDPLRPNITKVGEPINGSHGRTSKIVRAMAGTSLRANPIPTAT